MFNRLLVAVLIAGTAGTAAAQFPVMWPPMCSIAPPSPTSADQVTITLSGEWNDSCVPRESQITIVRNTIYFDVFHYSGGVCLMVISPWSLSQTVGPLAPGYYYVVATLYDYGAGWPPPSGWVTCSFAVTPAPPATVRPDLDHDGDVDQADFGLFQSCMSAPGQSVTGTACAVADLDADSDVDQDDFGVFQYCLTGAKVSADPNCAN
jgi:hypothetical protein